MSYKYEAASTSSRGRSSRQATSTGSASRPYAASGASIAATAEEAAYSTRALWDAVQAPTVHMAGAKRAKGVRFADEVDSSHLEPHGRQRPDSPASSVPSLSHSAEGEHEDDLKCPPTPEFKPRELPGSGRPRKAKQSLPPAHQAAYSTIGQIVHEFNSYVVAFALPRDLDFQAPAPGGNSTPALAFTPKNKPLLEHIKRLEDLQSELDEINSHNDNGIRQARKDAVVMIEHELEGLKRLQARQWSKFVHEQDKQRRAHRH